MRLTEESLANELKRATARPTEAGAELQWQRASARAQRRLALFSGVSVLAVIGILAGAALQIESQGDRPRHGSVTDTRLSALASRAAQSDFLVMVKQANASSEIVATNTASGSATAQSQQATAMNGGSESSFASPALSPGRNRLLSVMASYGQLQSNADEGDIVSSNLDGSDRQLLTSDGADASPQFSPNGKQIAFLRSGSLWLMSADGSNQHALSATVRGFTMAWSPDGRTLAVSSGTAPQRIALVDVASGDIKWFTPPGVEQLDPSWSPDGRMLVYAQSGTALDPNNAIWISKVDGSGATRLTSCPISSTTCTQDFLPDWSPDGSQIAFVRATQTGTEVYTIPAAGGTPQAVTSGSDNYTAPSW